MITLESLPFVPARDFGHGRGGKTIRLIVIHDAECNETPTAAEDLGTYGRHPDYPSSWHISVDSNSAERSVRDDDTAWAAPPLNSVALHIELAGKGNQTREQWLDTYSTSVLDNAAGLVAQWCKKYSIPVVHLSNGDLEQGAKGIVGHYQITAVYKKSDHTDPGNGFPWDDFMHRVSLKMAQLP